MTFGATDDEIAAALAARPVGQWQELFAIARSLTEVDRHIVWGGGQELEPGVVQAHYPIYSAAVRQLRALLPVAEFNWRRWCDGNPMYPEGHGLDVAPVADAVRLATVYLLEERFVDGLFGVAMRSGALDAIISRLRRWFETGE